MKIIRHLIGGPRYANKVIAEGAISSCGLTFPGPMVPPIAANVSLTVARTVGEGVYTFEVSFHDDDEARLAWNILDEYFRRRRIDPKKPGKTFILDAVDGNEQRKVVPVKKLDVILNMLEDSNLTPDDIDTINERLKAWLP